MKLRINGVLFDIVLTFLSPGTGTPWQAEAYRPDEYVEVISGVEDRVPEVVASGTTPAPIVFDTTDPEFNSQNGWSGIRIRDTSSTVVDGDGNWVSGTTIQP